MRTECTVDVEEDELTHVWAGIESEQEATNEIERIVGCCGDAVAATGRPGMAHGADAAESRQSMGRRADIKGQGISGTAESPEQTGHGIMVELS